MDDGIGVPNLFGLQGSEDIDASTKAVFRLVAQYMLGTGSIVGFKSNADQSSGLLFSREAFVGLADDHLGTLTFGRQQDFMVDTLLGDVDADAAAYVGGFYNFRDGPFGKLALPDSPPGEAYDFDHMSGSQPLSNSIKYKSPTFAGMSVGYLFAFGNTAGNFRQNSASSAGAVLPRVRSPLAPPIRPYDMRSWEAEPSRTSVPGCDIRLEPVRYLLFSRTLGTPQMEQQSIWFRRAAFIDSRLQLRSARTTCTCGGMR
jgi:hypothetical protein